MKVTLAQSYYRRGVDNLEEALSSGLKKYAKTSYLDFVKAETYGSVEQTLDSLKKKSIDYAQVIYQVDASAPFEITYDWEIDRALDDLEDRGDKFHQIYYESTTGNRKVDCDIDITFGSIDFDLDEDSETLDFSESIVVGTTTEMVDSMKVEVDVYEEVFGQVTITTIKKTADWKVRISVSNSTQNCDLGDNSFEEDFEFEIKKVSWNGDERAIPKEYKDFDSEDMIDEDEIAEQLLSKLVESIYSHF